VTGGAGVAVGAVGTGVDVRHPMLAGQVEPGSDLGGRAGDAEIDVCGHGTIVAGIVAARAVEGIGFVGVAPQARILPVRQAVGDSDGEVGVQAAGIVAAADAGARVVNVSVTVKTAIDAIRQAVQYAAGRDVLVVAAAGNDR